MNALPPKGQIPGKPTPDADHVRLTMDFASDLTEDSLPGTGDTELAPVPEQQPRAKRAQPPPAVPPGLAALELTLTVEVGQLRIPLRQLMAVEPGQLLALDRLTSEPVAVLVNGRLFAHGEIVAIRDRFGVRLTDIADASGGPV
jgi:flagellar motor switch protein FliN